MGEIDWAHGAMATDARHGALVALEHLTNARLTAEEAGEGEERGGGDGGVSRSRDKHRCHLHGCQASQYALFIWVKL